MPYIRPERREELASGSKVRTPGELNYAITKCITRYLANQSLYGDYNYTDLNDVIGALEAAKLEFYRRVVVPYEEQKIKENGDVF